MRSGWKFAVYSVLLVGLFVGAGIAFAMIAAWVDPSLLLLPREDIRFLGLNAVVLFVPSVLALVIMARFVDRVPIMVFGVTPHQGWLRDFGVGLVIAGALVALAIGIAAVFGGLEMQWTVTAAALPGIAGTVAVLAVAALNEELVFRGYPLQIFLKGIGPLPAMLLISFLFALLHSDNDGATVLSTVNTVIAGVFLSRAYLETRSIWLPYGIHLGWNVGTAVVVGVPVSGIDTASIVRTQMQGPPIVVGGEYGPEGSLIGTLVFLAGAILIRRLHIGKVSPEIQAALAGHAEKVYIEKRD